MKSLLDDAIRKRIQESREECRKRDESLQVVAAGQQVPGDKPQSVPNMIDSLKVNKGQPMPVVDNIYTLEETADKLKMSVRNVRRWVDEGKIKAFKLGREWRVHEDDLQAVIDNARKG